MTAGQSLGGDQNHSAASNHTTFGGVCVSLSYFAEALLVSDSRAAPLVTNDGLQV